MGVLRSGWQLELIGVEKEELINPLIGI